MGEQNPSASQGEKGRVYNCMKLPRWRAGALWPNAFSAKVMNRHVDVLESALNAEIHPPTAGNIVWADGNLVFDLSPLVSGASGAGIATQVTITADEGDYLQCVTTGSTTLLVAKATTHRISVSSTVVDGVTISYSAYTTDSNGLYNQRTATGNGVTKQEAPTPRWALSGPGSVLTVMPVDHTGVLVSGTELTWIDLNVDGRYWAQKYDQS